MNKLFCASCKEETFHAFIKFSDVAEIENSNTSKTLDLWVTYCEECLTVKDDETFTE